MNWGIVRSSLLWWDQIAVLCRRWNAGRIGPHAGQRLLVKHCRQVGVYIVAFRSSFEDAPTMDTWNFARVHEGLSVLTLDYSGYHVSILPICDCSPSPIQHCECWCQSRVKGNNDVVSFDYSGEESHKFCYYGLGPLERMKWTSVKTPLHWTGCLNQRCFSVLASITITLIICSRCFELRLLYHARSRQAGLWCVSTI